MLKNYYSGSIKVDNIVIGSIEDHLTDILPTAYKVILSNLSVANNSTATLKVTASPYSDHAEVLTGAASGGGAITRVANSFIINSKNLYTVAAGDAAQSATGLTITTATAVPEIAVGAPVRLLFSGADPLQKALPDIMYISSISGDTVTIKLQGAAITSTAASGLQILSSRSLKKNLPATITSVTVTGDKATFFGSFPHISVMTGSTVAVKSNSPFVADSMKGKKESYRFVIKNVTEAAGTFTVEGVKGKLISMEVGTQGVGCEIDLESGFGNYNAREEAYFNSGFNRINLAGVGTDGDEIMIEQYIAG